MRNEQASADHLLSTDALIAHAASSGRTFSVELAEPLAKAFIGDKLVGFLDRDTLDLIQRPHVLPDDSFAAYVADLHRRADQTHKRGICYFIGGNDTAIKIGHSVDVQSRLSAIRSCSPVPLSLLAVRDGGEPREAAYHAQFAHRRLHGEWFERCPEIEAEITRLSTPEGEG